MPPMAIHSTALYYKQNRLKQLRAFCGSVRAGSITQAAKALFLSQPSVSLQIQALEREFGVTLYERRGPTIKLTPEGELLHQLALPLIEGIDKLHETFAAHYGRLETGELNIAAGESTILNILTEPLKAFAEQYPGIRIKLHNVTGREGLDMLRNDEADFAVGPMLRPMEEFIYQPVVTYYPTLIVPLGHPLAGRKKVTLEEISAYRLILPPAHLSTWQLVDGAFRQHGLSYNVVLEAGGWEGIKKFVELGLGVSIVTDVCLTGDERLSRIPLSEYFPNRSYGIVQRKGKFLFPQAKRFIEALASPSASKHQTV